MKTISLLILCACSKAQILLPILAGASSGPTYLHTRMLTVDHTKVPNTNQTAFPVLFRSPTGTVNTSGTAVTLSTGDNFPTWMDAIDINGTTYTFTRTSGSAGTTGVSAGTQTGVEYGGTPYLKTVANGGLVQHTAAQTGGGSGLTVPADAIVTSDSGCTTKLPVEWETWSASTGVAIFWYQQTLSTSVDTVAYNCYDSASITTYQGNVNGVWNSNYKGVWHFPDGTILGMNDSTSNANNATAGAAGPTATSGEIDGGTLFISASSQYATVPAISAFGSATKVVLSSWVKRTAASNEVDIVQDTGTYDTSTFGLTLYTDGIVYFVVGGQYGQIGRNVNTFDHLVMVYDGSQSTDATKLVAYLDGVQQTLTFSGGIPTSLGSAATFYFGRRPDISLYSDGSVDEVHLMIGATVSSDWVKTEYNNQGSPLTFISVGSQT